TSGNPVATYSYDAYGNVPSGWKTGTATTPFQFAGQYRDVETGFDYLQARFYDPSTGQFLTVDPGFPLTNSRYGYSLENPLNYTDPDGLRPLVDAPTVPVGDSMDAPTANPTASTDE